MRTISFIILSLSIIVLGRCDSKEDFPVSQAVLDHSTLQRSFHREDKLRYRQKYAMAVEKYRTRLRASGLTSGDSLYAINQLVYCHLMLNQSGEEVEGSLRLAERLIRDHGNYDTSLFADLLYNRGRRHYLNGEPDSALAYVHRALNRYQGLGYGDHLRVAQSLTLLALIHFENGLLTDSTTFYAMQANDIFQNDASLYPFSWEIDYALACASLLNRAHERGATYCETAVEKLRLSSIQNDEFESRCWSMLGNMLKKRGDALSSIGRQDAAGKRDSLYALADSICYPKAVALTRKAGSSFIQEVYRDWIILSTRFGNPGRFFSLLSELKEIQDTQPEKRAFPNRLLGYYFDEQSGKSAADSTLMFYHRFLEENDGNAEIPVQLLDEAYYVLAYTYKKLDRFDRAVYYCQKGIELYDCAPEGVGYLSQATVQELDLSRTPCVNYVAFLAETLMEAYLRTGQSGYLNLCNRYFSLVEEHFYQSLLQPDEEVLLSLQLETGKNIFIKALRAAYEAWKIDQDKRWIAKAFSYAEKIKSFLLYRDIFIALDSSGHSVTLLDSVRFYQGKVNRLRYQLDRAGENKDLKLLRQWEKTNFQLNNAVAARQKEYVDLESTVSQSFLDLEEIQQSLHPNEAVVQYVTGMDEVFIIFASRETCDFRMIEDKKKLDDTIEAYRKSLEAKNHPRSVVRQYLAAAGELYDQLVDPFAASLRQDQVLVVIPDRGLDHIPFEAFLTGALDLEGLTYNELPYLVREIDLVYTPSWKIFKANAARSGKGGPYRKIGAWIDPAMQALVAGSLRAVENLTSDQAAVFSENSGGKEHFLTNQSGQDLIYLFLHARSSRIDRLDNKIFFGAKPADYLYGFELSSHRFSAGLAVLGACETAYGAARQGEGTYSLTRALQQAGVPQIVSTLWKVNPGATDDLLARFYHHLGSGKEPSSALRSAKLDYLKQTPEPYLAYPGKWAGVVLFR